MLATSLARDTNRLTIEVFISVTRLRFWFWVSQTH